MEALRAGAGPERARAGRPLPGRRPARGPRAARRGPARIGLGRAPDDAGRHDPRDGRPHARRVLRGGFRSRPARGHARPGPELLLPRPRRGREHRGARGGGARRAARAGRALRDRRASTTAARTARRPSPTGWPPSIPASCGSSITPSTRATARRSVRACGRPATRSSASPTATASSASRTSPGSWRGWRTTRPRRGRRTSWSAIASSGRTRHPAGLRTRLPGLPAPLLRARGARPRLRLQALPARGARGRPRGVGRRLPVRRAAHQDRRARRAHRRGGRAALPADRGPGVGCEPAGRGPRGARLLAAPRCASGRAGRRRSVAGRRCWATLRGRRTRPPRTPSRSRGPTQGRRTVRASGAVRAHPTDGRPAAGRRAAHRDDRARRFPPPGARPGPRPAS